MARKSGREPSVSLFPFLAVLVCVMGSLIFLLLATTKRMHDIAAAEARWKAEPQITLPRVELGTPSKVLSPTPLDGEVAIRRREQEQLLERRISELQARRDELQQLMEQQERLGRKSAQQVAALEQDLQQGQTRLRGILASIESVPDEAAMAENLADLEAQISELRRKLRQLQNRRTEGNSKFTVVPFDVRSGTTRRPILIECTDQGLRFLPEDVFIKPYDLEGFTERYNPLLTGARTLIGYWHEHDRTAGPTDLDGEPYVLLIVRPSGIVAYYVAMKMLSTLKQPFGYELVDDSITLQPPPLDEMAQAQCRMAIEQQLAERGGVAGSGRGSGGAGGGRGGGKAGGRGAPKETFEVSDILPREETVGERSWENFDRFEGRQNRAQSATPGSAAPGRVLPGAGNDGNGSSTGAEAGHRASTGNLRDGQEPAAGTAGGTGENSETGQGRLPPGGSPEDAGGKQPGRRSPSGAGVAASEGEGQSGEPPEEFPINPSDPEPRSAREATPSRERGDRPEGTNDPSGDSPGTPEPRAGQQPLRRQAPRRAAPNPAHHKSQDADSQWGQLARRHWGESEPGATIGIEHDVAVRVDADRIIVANKHQIAYRPGENSKDLFLRVLEAVDREAQDWGKPKRGFYWTPRLRFVISPGGNQAFERIDPLVTKSGLSLTTDFTLSSARSSQGEAER